MHYKYHVSKIANNIIFCIHFLISLDVRSVKTNTYNYSIYIARQNIINHLAKRTDVLTKILYCNNNSIIGKQKLYK